GMQAPADEVEQRGLAGAVRADHGDALPLLHRQVGAADDLGAPEALAQVLQFEGVGHAVISLRLISASISSCARPQTRTKRRRTISISAPPTTASATAPTQVAVEDVSSSP